MSNVFARLALVLALVVAVGACKKKDNKDAAKNTSKVAALEHKPEATTPAAPTIGEALVKVAKDCYAALDAEDPDKFGKCFAADALFGVSDHIPPMENKGRDAILASGIKPLWDAFKLNHSLQLIAVNGDKLATIALVVAENDGPLPGGVPATGKKIGLWSASHTSTDGKGQAKQDWHYFDQTSLAGQLGLMPKGTPFRAASDKGWDEPIVVVANNDDTEKANLTAYKAWLAAINKGDLKAAGSVLTAETAFRHMDAPADTAGKDTIIGVLKSYRGGFSNMKLTSVEAWAAGDWTVSRTDFSGKNDGDIPPMKVKATGKEVVVHSLDLTQWQAGKVVQHIVFTNGYSFAAQLGLIDPSGSAKR